MKTNFSEQIKQVGRIVDSWLPLKIKYDHTPGISVGIVYKGKLSYKKGFGFADVEKKQRANEKTLYHIASISKTFTAVSIMQLVEKGKLRLDDKVISYVPWFKAKGESGDTKYVTIRQLLSHTAGVFRDGDTPQWETGKFPKDLKSSFSNKSLRIENLTGFKYSNYGFSIFGEIIKNVSGLSYEEYVTENILRPLGMKDTLPDYRDGSGDVASGYGRIIPDKKREKFPHYKTYAYAPATGFLSNVADLSKYLSALSLGNESKILSRESKKEMMHPYEKTQNGEEYGLGLDICQINGRKIVGHGGGFNGFITRISLDAESGLGVIVLSNSLESYAPAIVQSIFEGIYELSDKRPKYMDNIKINFKTYEGVYRSVWGDEVIVRTGNTLMGFSVDSNSPFKWATLLIPEKMANHFLMKDKSVFGGKNEIAIFGEVRNGKAKKVTFGATPSKRV